MLCKTLRFLALPSLVVANELNFLVMGDWGGSSSAPYTHQTEIDTATSMNVAAGELGARFTLALGDNFYSRGVVDVDDPRFEHTFENVFTGQHLTEESGHKFHVIAGNHDHKGNVTAQVAYSERSARWSFPSQWYSFSKTAPDGATVDFVMIDTVVISGQATVGDPEDNVSLCGNELPGPENLAAAESQLQWIDETLAKSTADYVIVSGHYPVHSAGDHGPTSSLSPERFPYLQKHKVSAYLCGHDHSEQYIDMGDGIQYHVIGSANYRSNFDNLDKYTNEQIKFKALTYGGYAAISVSKEGMQIRHFDGSGKLLYTAPMVLPRGSTEPQPPSPTPLPTTTPSPIGTCSDEDSWPDRDHGLVCGECKVLVNKFDSVYKSCNGYCQAIGRTCAGAWEEVHDDCNELFGMKCDQELDSSDAICQCNGDRCAAVATWPDLDHGLVCGECKVLVNNFDTKYTNCDGYCQSISRTCIGAWEEVHDTCDVKYEMSCSEQLDSSDAICQCSGDEAKSMDAIV